MCSTFSTPSAPQVGLYTLLAPYFVAFSQFTMGRDLGMQIYLRQFGQTEKNAAAASVDDTFIWPILRTPSMRSTVSP
jgi:hypothetical protein